MSDLEKAFEIIEEGSDLADFEGPKDEKLVAAAEKALGLKFPPTYRRFLLELGAGSFGGAEIYGVIDGNFTDSSVPNGIWLTLQEREESQLPAILVVVAATGEGGYDCLDVRGAGEAKVVLFAPGSKSQTLEVEAEDFGAFLLDQVRAEQEGE
jgi:hypothetical protein